ncbi:MAG: CbiX/SirB N-terminal domain-containing protein [Rhodocyclaceae bacterium]|nr:CbiX/SirB N-terminal domain-containing protein [Rhodocyclaceae bacterium]
MTKEAILVFAHGARDPAWAEPLERICALVRQRRPEVRVELAFLELMQPLIGEALDRMAGAGFARITIVPAFMAPGGHIRKDLPELVAAARVRHPGLEVRVTAAIGQSEGVISAIADFAISALAAS